MWERKVHPGTIAFVAKLRDPIRLNSSCLVHFFQFANESRRASSFCFFSSEILASVATVFKIMPRTSRHWVGRTTLWGARGYQDKKPLDKNPPDINPQTKTPLPKIPQTKTPQTKHSFQKFYDFCFQNELWKRNLNLVFSSKIHKAWIYKVVHGWHNLMVGWWFLKEPFWVA